MTNQTATASRTIHVAHSPDSDDAFMFYALATGKVDTEGLTYVHELQDIESLNQRALRGEPRGVHRQPGAPPRTGRCDRCGCRAPA